MFTGILTIIMYILIITYLAVLIIYAFLESRGKDKRRKRRWKK